ncbi:MAG: tRNA-dihydrouridine synthase family protein, partial [Promethearchaeota archaeon]
MKLGRLKLSNKLMLAPMLKVTTAPYRRFCRRLSGKIGLVFVPMLYTKRIEKCPKSVIKPLYRISEERPIGVQLIGSDPIALKKTIEHLESYEFDVLDINAGCPSRRAVKLQEGGYILNNLNNLAKIINVATKYSSRPVSVKIRIGVNKPLNLQSLSRIINDSGLEFITVHGRTVKEKFDDSKLNLEFIRNLKEEVNIPIIGNGSIDSPQFAEHFLKYTRVDGLMIGRASIGNPEIFKQI